MNFLSSSLERKFKKIIPSNIKNFIILLICNRFFGKLIKFFNIKKNFFGGFYDYSLVSDIDSARIFWGIWESAEIRFSKRFANSETIIELGSSVGVTLGVLSEKRKNKKFICVEASNKNFEKLKILKKQLSKKNEYILVNKAISHNEEKITLIDTISSKASQIDYKKDFDKKLYLDLLSKSDPNNPTIEVPTISLSKVIEDYDVKGRYCLITDIEGAQASIFFKDSDSLTNCERIIAELSDHPLGNVEDQINKLISIGFSITEKYGSVLVLS